MEGRKRRRCDGSGSPGASDGAAGREQAGAGVGSRPEAGVAEQQPGGPSPDGDGDAQPCPSMANLMEDRWLNTSTVDRRSGTTMGVAQFRAEYAAGAGKPVVITDVVPSWPAFREWRADRLAERFGETTWRVSATTDMQMNQFLA